MIDETPWPDLPENDFVLHPRQWKHIEAAKAKRRGPWRTVLLVILATTAPVAAVGIWFLATGGL